MKIYDVAQTTDKVAQRIYQYNIQETMQLAFNDKIRLIRALSPESLCMYPI